MRLQEAWVFEKCSGFYDIYRSIAFISLWEFLAGHKGIGVIADSAQIPSFIKYKGFEDCIIVFCYTNERITTLFGESLKGFINMSSPPKWRGGSAIRSSLYSLIFLVCFCRLKCHLLYFFHYQLWYLLLSKPLVYEVHR